MLVDLLRALSRAFKRTQYIPITFYVTLRTEPYRGSERVIWGGLVATGAYARAGGDYSALTLRSIVGIRRLHWLLFFDQTPLLKYQPIAL